MSFDLPVRPIRQAHGPEALEGQAQGPDPSTHRLAQGGEEDRTTMLRVMVRYSNHEALEGEALDRWYGVNEIERDRGVWPY